MPQSAEIQHPTAHISIGRKLDHSADPLTVLKQLHLNCHRDNRIIVQLSHPLLAFLLLKLRPMISASRPFTNLVSLDLLKNFCFLSNYEIVRIQPKFFLGFQSKYIQPVGRLLAILPFGDLLFKERHVFLRPIKPELIKPLLSVIVPARNEQGNIKNILNGLAEIDNIPLEVIFVEGGSQDDTYKEIERCLSKETRFQIAPKLFKQSGKGKVDAVRLGFQKCTGQVLTILDSDLTVPANQLPHFYQAYCQGKGDYINGSRLRLPMQWKAMPIINFFGNHFFAKLLSWILQMQMTDSLCGTKMFSRQTYQRFTAWRSEFGDFDPFGDYEVIFPAADLAIGSTDIPVHYLARTYGATNIQRFYHALVLLRMCAVGFFKIRLGLRRSGNAQLPLMQESST